MTSHPPTRRIAQQTDDVESADGSIRIATQPDTERRKELTAALMSRYSYVRMAAVESLMRGEGRGLMTFTEIGEILDHRENTLKLKGKINKNPRQENATMTTISKYKCEICRNDFDAADVRGVYWPDVSPALDQPQKCGRHICLLCLDSLAEARIKETTTRKTAETKPESLIGEHNDKD